MEGQQVVPDTTFTATESGKYLFIYNVSTTFNNDADVTYAFFKNGVEEITNSAILSQFDPTPALPPGQTYIFNIPSSTCVVVDLNSGEAIDIHATVHLGTGTVQIASSLVTVIKIG